MKCLFFIDMIGQDQKKRGIFYLSEDRSRESINMSLSGNEKNQISAESKMRM